ncbi:MAG TPA: menaquinol-cytochrome C reductase [Symbiobacteriaceae bacterium]|nr:menaquinol-cytochrome C reductase [Symbiobacteriaceae bacterium]
MADMTEKYQQAGPKVQPGAKEEMVYTWPYLVSIEAIMAVAMTLSLTIMSLLVNAPLLDLANPDHTPNPAKAPWYFLGLQELLLHMHPALAGVIVPTAALVLLGMIPYIDRDRRGTGIWFSTKKGVPIAILSAIYTAVIEIALVVIDEFLIIPGIHPEGSHGIAPLIKFGLAKAFGIDGSWVAWVGEILLPIIFMIAIPWILASWVKRRYKANTREIMIALYTFYLTSFVVLSLIGTAFRGESMKLMWPWMVKPPH